MKIIANINGWSAEMKNCLFVKITTRFSWDNSSFTDGLIQTLGKDSQNESFVHDKVYFLYSVSKKKPIIVIFIENH